MIDLEKFEAKDFLPHREPFLMVEKIFDISEKTVITGFEVKSNNIFVNKDNKLSESGLIEHIAQSCSSIVGKTYLDANAAMKLIGFISTIKKAEILSLPGLGDFIKTEANLVSRMDTDDFSMCTIDSTSYVAGQEVAKCKLNLMIQELKS